MKCLMATFILIITLSSKLWGISPIDQIKSHPNATTVESKIIVGEVLKSESTSRDHQEVTKSEFQEVKQQVSLEPLLGFQGWKEKQVLRAKTNLNQFKAPKGDVIQETNPLSIKNVENSAEKVEIEKIQSNQAEKLRQLEFNLEIALGLTIHDYFSLYLKDKSQEEMAIVIPKLTPEELSTLLVAYRKSLYGLPIVEKENDKTLN